MFCRFSSRVRVKGRVRARSQALAMMWSPMQRLIAGLRGRSVAVLVGGREIEGRVVSADPVILADGQGTVKVVPIDGIVSIRY